MEMDARTLQVRDRRRQVLSLNLERADVRGTPLGPGDAPLIGGHAWD